MKNVKKAYYVTVIIGIGTLAIYVVFVNAMVQIWESNPSLLGVIGTVMFPVYIVYKAVNKLSKVVLNHYQQKDLLGFYGVSEIWCACNTENFAKLFGAHK